VGILMGIYGREELEPQPQLNASLMGILIKDHEGKEPITALQAQEMYLKIGGVSADVQGTVQLQKPVSVEKCKVCTSRCHGKNPSYFANYVRGKIKKNSKW